ncbi:MAG TPA: TadE family protein [Candidatus Limnocylindrales bacterium]|nr:TadE family protein [Candidatus Limnocylindrales bacterium]
MSGQRSSGRQLRGRAVSRRGGRGQALAEFALVAPIFFLLLFGVIEAGRFMFYYEVLNHATREGARYAIVNGSNSLYCPTGTPAPGSYACDPTGEDVKDRVRSAAFSTLGSSLTVPTPTWAPDNSRGSTVTVTADYAYSTLIPIVPLPPINVHAESTLVVNN